jgi:hypothetical protein
MRTPNKNKKGHKAEYPEVLLQEHGWHGVIMCDNGPEFLGAVDQLFKRKKVKVIKGRP